MVGNTPGYAKSIGFTFAFGSDPKAFTLGLNTFEFVFSSTCTSSPIMVSQFIMLSLPMSGALHDRLSLVHKHKLLVKLSPHQNVDRRSASHSAIRPQKNRMVKKELELQLNSLESLTYHWHTSRPGHRFLHQT